MSRIGTIDEVRQQVDTLSQAVSEISLQGSVNTRLAACLDTLGSSSSIWNSFLNRVIEANLAPSISPNYDGAQVAKAVKEDDLGLPEFTSLFAVGLLGLNRLLDEIIHSARLSDLERLRHSTVVNDTYNLLNRFMRVNTSIHGDPVHWLGEAAQDRANWSLREGDLARAASIVVQAQYQFNELTPPAENWDQVAWHAAEAVLLARFGQATRDLDPIIEGIEQLKDIYPDYKNRDRLRALGNILMRTALRSGSPTHILHALRVQHDISTFLNQNSGAQSRL